MASLILSRAALDAMSEWNREQTGRGADFGQTTLRPDGMYDVPIRDGTAERLERFRMPGESDDALIFRVINSPGRGRPQ